MADAAFLRRGWQVYPAERVVSDWVAGVKTAAFDAAGDAGLRTAWLRHGGTWFAGVDALPNDALGRVGDGPPLAGAAFADAQAWFGDLPLHPAQVSVTYPGYPRQDPDESDAAHRYRTRRDAAHLDGLLPEGAARRRHLREPHAYILGIALTDADPEAAPLVVWEGSHEILGAAFRQAFQDLPPEHWGDLDVTEIYQVARKACFGACARKALPLKKGEAVLLHRLLLHGVAPWQEGAEAPVEGRAIAYFRPVLGAVSEWLALP